MVQTEHQIVLQVQAAQSDSDAADALIRQYMDFIRSETSKFVKGPLNETHDDALSIAMLAFYEAILGYQRLRGAFLPYAARSIRNRLIDHYRREKRHQGVLSLHSPQNEEEDVLLLDTVRDERDLIGSFTAREATSKEIAEFSEQLARLGLTFSKVAESCPRQNRTLEACHRVLACARRDPELLERFERTGRLPIRELAEGSGVERKTIERHRNYLVALLLAFTNGYEIIRGHLCQITPKERWRA